MTQDFKCSECNSEDEEYLIEGWFYTKERLNPFGIGTASAGLMQLRVMCEECVKEYKALGLWCGEDKIK
jgi:hypothetical protein